MSLENQYFTEFKIQKQNISPLAKTHCRDGPTIHKLCNFSFHGVAVQPYSWSSVLAGILPTIFTMTTKSSGWLHPFLLTMQALPAAQHLTSLPIYRSITTHACFLTNLLHLTNLMSLGFTLLLNSNLTSVYMWHRGSRWYTSELGVVTTVI